MNTLEKIFKKLKVNTIVALLFLYLFVTSAEGIAIITISLIALFIYKNIKFNKKIEPIKSAQKILVNGCCDGIKCSNCYSNYVESVFKLCPYRREDSLKPYEVNGSIDLVSIRKLEGYLKRRDILKVKKNSN